MRPEVARRYTSLVHRLRIAARPHEGVVIKKCRDRLRDDAADDLAGRRFRLNDQWRHLWRFHRSRTEGPDVLGSRVGRAGAGATKPRHQRSDDAIRLSGDLDLDLTET